MYEKAARAYVKGLQRRVAENKPVDKIRSVNSVFVSRIDTAVDKILQRAHRQRREARRHCSARPASPASSSRIKSSKRFSRATNSRRFSAKGGAAQRPLWASTSTKNPALSRPDVRRDRRRSATPSTRCRRQTLDALLDHGKIVARHRRERPRRGARRSARHLHDAKISLFDVTRQLQTEGVTSFSDSFAALLGAIVYKQKLLASGARARRALAGNSAQAHYDAALERSRKPISSSGCGRTIRRCGRPIRPPRRSSRSRSAGSTFRSTCSNRCRISPRSATTMAQKFDFAVVCGMGGSSLAPDMLRRDVRRRRRGPARTATCSTRPARSRSKSSKRRSRSPQTLFIISSKSGTTTEPNAFYAYFHEKVGKALGATVAGRNFIAITDPGSPLEAEAKEAGFAAVFDNDPNIGGRYSALSYVGIVPAAIAGYDVNLLLDRALGAMHANDRTVDPRTRARRALRRGDRRPRRQRPRQADDRHASRTFERSATWAEQLIAESTGKHGKGIVPVEGEPLGDPGVYSDDRLFVYVGANMPDPEPGVDEKLRALEAAGHPVIRLAMNDEYDLGEQFYLWEIAVAAAGSFSASTRSISPTCKSPKTTRSRCSSSTRKNGKFRRADGRRRGSTLRRHVPLRQQASIARQELRCRRWPALFAQLEAGRLQRDHRVHRAQPNARRRCLRELRVKVRDARKVATTVGFGPRFLHSTGQLHKGGPDQVRHHADHVRRSRRSADPRHERRLPHAAGGASAGRLAVARQAQPPRRARSPQGRSWNRRCAR